MMCFAMWEVMVQYKDEMTEPFFTKIGMIIEGPETFDEIPASVDEHVFHWVDEAPVEGLDLGDAVITELGEGSLFVLRQTTEMVEINLKVMKRILP